MDERHDWAAAILTTLRTDIRKGWSEKRLLAELGAKGKQARACLDELARLETQGKVEHDRKGWWRLATTTAAAAEAPAHSRRGKGGEREGRQRRGGRPAAGGGELVEGVLSVTAGGVGFVAPGKGRADVFVPPQHLCDALGGDIVRVEVTEPEHPKGPAGRIVEVVTPGPELVAGEFRGGILRPLRRDLPREIPVTLPPRIQRPQDGDWIATRLNREEWREHARLTADFAGLYGRGDSVEATLDAVMDEFALPDPYTAAQNTEAGQLRPRPDLPIEDLTHLTVLTMDPVDAKDFDDALSVQPGSRPDTVVVGIHIAAVAAFVTPGHWLDAEAARRGFTSYLPGRTLPMIPHSLSTGLCSLNPEVERLAHTVFVELSREDGTVLKTRRCHGRIRSRKRLTYEEGQAFIDSGAAPGWPREVQETFAELLAISRRLRRRREETEHFLDLAAPEFRIVCRGAPLKVERLELRQPLEAHALVEEFMLLANWAVADETVRRRIPGLYRVHEAPAPRDQAQFLDWLHDTFNLKPGRLATRAAMNRFLLSLRDETVTTLVMQEFLRSLPRAVYSATCAPHFGLGKERYSHFTSPIRRYADLVVHQQLVAADLRQPHRPLAEMEQLGHDVSKLEERTDNAYFAAADRLKLHFLRDRLAENPGLLLDGIAARYNADGLIVYISHFSLRGLVPGDSARRRPPCGERVQVRPERLDPVRGELELRLVGGEGATDAGPGRRPPPHRPRRRRE
ncbi:MAG: ribonuclease R family protein [Lentisphaeria bacterium]